MNRQLNVLSGNRLTNGSVLEMHVRYLECILDSDASVLKAIPLHQFSSSENSCMSIPCSQQVS